MNISEAKETLETLKAGVNDGWSEAIDTLLKSHDDLETKLKQETHAKEEVLKWYKDACEELDGGKQVAVDEMIIGKKEWETMTEAQQSYVKGWNACQRKYGTPKQEVDNENNT